MFNDNYNWHYDYIQLASDTSFTFERHKPDSFSKNKIYSVDIDRIIDEKDVSAVDKLIPSVVSFVLDPEQARILDEGFVKVFRLSQLAVQYLIFCKHHLDNTVVVIKEETLKLKEENKELNLFVDDLKEHVAKLMKDLSTRNAFTCEHCSKLFSTEEFLNSHIKRRHNTPLLQADTDKLHIEIKELKGRLNSAEKMIQKDHLHTNESQTNMVKELEQHKIEDLYHKFEDLRFQVQSELKILQTQYNFQEKYERLLEKIALQKDVPPAPEKCDSRDLLQRRESTTQTEFTEHVETAQEKNKENISDFTNMQRQMADFEEVLDIKVTSSLHKIEQQIQSFWDKLHQMEIYKPRYSPQDSEISDKTKPVVKPRLKYVAKDVPQDNINIEKETYLPVYDASDSVTKDKVVIDIVEKSSDKKSDKGLDHVEQGISTVWQKKAQSSDDFSSSNSTVSTSSSCDEEIDKSLEPVATKEQPLISIRSRSIINEKFLERFRNEIEKVVLGRLQDLGVSPEWKGLPDNSFQKAMETTRHQANLLKKSHPNFNALLLKIEEDVTKNIKNKNLNHKRVVQKKSIPRYKVKTITNNPGSPHPLEIRNREMYETDSESEIKPSIHKNSYTRPFAAVIAELKTVTKRVEDSDKSQSSLVKEETAVQHDDKTKGVLKNYPSVGSLTKKRVLFNLNVANNNRSLPIRDAGSTTSMASSVFDVTPREGDAKHKDVEDLSDFDFHDI